MFCTNVCTCVFRVQGSLLTKQKLRYGEMCCVPDIWLFLMWACGFMFCSLVGGCWCSLQVYVPASSGCREVCRPNRKWSRVKCVVFQTSGCSYCGHVGLFYVLLTMHLGSVLVNNPPDTQFFFHIYLFQFSTCFEHPCTHHHQETQLY